MSQIAIVKLPNKRGRGRRGGRQQGGQLGAALAALGAVRAAKPVSKATDLFNTVVPKNTRKKLGRSKFGSVVSEGAKVLRRLGFNEAQSGGNRGRVRVGRKRNVIVL